MRRVFALALPAHNIGVSDVLEVFFLGVNTPCPLPHPDAPAASDACPLPGVVSPLANDNQGVLSAALLREVSREPASTCRSRWRCFVGLPEVSIALRV